jgi:two-component system, LytTR family, sensor kinase
MRLELPQAVNVAKRFTKTRVFALWIVIVVLFASQWYAYDAVHSPADPFLYYLGWSFYLWGVLTPSAVWLAGRYPIHGNTWFRIVLLYVAASLFLITAQLCLEASVAWFRVGKPGALPAMLWHYLKQHTQIGFVTFWAVIGLVHFYRIHDEARKRHLRAAQLEARLAEAQMENLRAQLHPHFLFNTLQAAATLIHEDPEGAEDILIRLSELLRVSLDELRAHEISLAREVDFLRHYIGIQQRRFGDRLRFDLRLDPDALDCAVPTLVLQPLVENAVRHGVGKHKETDVITIRAFLEQDRLCLGVSNLTSSLDDSPDRLSSRGVGLANTRGRLEQLYGREQQLRMHNLEPRGVSVQIVIPVRRIRSEEPVATDVGVA